MIVRPSFLSTPRRRAAGAGTVAAAVAAIALSGALAATGAMAAPASAGRLQALTAAAPANATAQAAATRTVTLINGDRVAVTTIGLGAHVTTAASTAGTGVGGIMIRLALDGKAYEIPADALPYLNRGLSPALFELSSLLTEESAGRLPVQVSYRGRLHALPGVTITRSSGGTARGYLTASSATAFGAALARQFAADHMALGLFFDVSGTGAGALRMVTLPQFSVTGDTTVAVNEQTATDKIQMVTPRAAVTRDVSFTVSRSTAAGDQIVSSVDAGNAPLWTNLTTVPVTVGTLRTITTGYLTSRATGPRYEYDLAFAGPSGLIGPQQYTVAPGSLAAVSSRFFQRGASVGGWAPGQLFGFEFAGGFAVEFTDIFPFGLPRSEIQYFSAGPSLYWLNQYWQSYNILGGGQADAPRTFAPGESTDEDWNAGPLHPAPDVSLLGAGSPFPTLPSANRFGNTLMLDFTPFTDSRAGG